ncbi:MAG: hypothetical protein KAK00_03200 [Nanoarchaeota archaeon]|nr:hypothetical protein [Nanoarchaeota archaeon]
MKKNESKVETKKEELNYGEILGDNVPLIPIPETTWQTRPGRGTNPPKAVSKRN